MGATIHWDYNATLPGTGGTTPNQITDSYTIYLGPNTPAARPVTVWSFNSPRVPAVGTFTDSAGNPTFFPANNIALSLSKQGWEGIDSVAQTISHEKTHVRVRRMWAEGGTWRTAYGPRATGPGGNDRDSDWLPNVIEDGFGTRWDQTRTFPLTFYLTGTDEEVMCEVSAGVPNLPQDNDWAYPGKQWH